MKYALLSVVIPLFNEADNIEPLYQELCPVLAQCTLFNDYEIIMVNDGSRDNSLKLLKQLAQYDQHVKIISFTRNFGHEYATRAGLQHAQGDAVVLIDADRQDPPEVILAFEKEFAQGYQVIYGQRKKRLNEAWFKKITSKAFYPLFAWITGVDMPRDVGDFCMLSRKAVDFLKKFNETTIFVRGQIFWLGLPKKAVFFVRRSRGAGKSKYNYPKLFIFALDNIISFSTVPIYIMIFLALILILCCAIGTCIAFLMHCCGFVVMTGWTSLIMCMLFLFASTLFFLGILGLYVGKIFQEVKQRPIFLIDEMINFK